jgi:uncharacterized membrane-anchored protein YhcB (DUF1043 family)
MLETSQDIWWLVFAFVTLWVGVFIGWSIFYLTMILRDMKKITGNVKQKLDTIDQILKIFKGKAEKGANYLPILLSGVGKVYDHLSKKKVKKAAKKTKVKSKK